MENPKSTMIHYAIVICIALLIFKTCSHESHAEPLNSQRFSQDSVCDWSQPGSNTYKGEDPVLALNDYKLESGVRNRLQDKMRSHRYDDYVVISKEAVYSSTQEYGDLRDMHFGNGKFCKGFVLRKAWQDTDQQSALVYCEQDICIVVPTICNNVSLATPKHDEVLP